VQSICIEMRRMTWIPRDVVHVSDSNMGPRFKCAATSACAFYWHYLLSIAGNADRQSRDWRANDPAIDARHPTCLCISFSQFNVYCWCRIIQTRYTRYREKYRRKSNQRLQVRSCYWCNRCNAGHSYLFWNQCVRGSVTFDSLRLYHVTDCNIETFW